MLERPKPFTEEEKLLICENYGTKGAEWCAMRLKRRLLSIQMYVARRRKAILDGKSDEIYAKYVEPKKLDHDVKRSWPYE